MNYKFIDIGCCHYSVSSDMFGLNVLGLLVEPVKEFCDVLPNSSTVLVECSAIAEKDGKTKMNIFLDHNNSPIEYITTDVWRDDKKRTRFFKTRYSECGRSTLLPFDVLLLRKEWGLPNTEREINTLTLLSLINKYNITSVDYLKIDVEGYEEIILNQLLDLMRSNKFIVNKQIKFEYNELSNLDSLDRIKEAIETEFGFTSRYEKVGWDEDIIMDKV